MDLTYLTLIALSVYVLFDGINETLHDREIEEMKERINELEEKLKKYENQKVK